jgi:hypothetical protein
VQSIAHRWNTTNSYRVKGVRTIETMLAANRPTVDASLVARRFMRRWRKIMKIVVKLLGVLIVVDGHAGCVVAPPYAPAYGYYPAPAYVGVGMGFGGGWHGR